MRLVDLAPRVGLSTARLSEVERGLGGSLPLASWVRLGIAVGRPFAIRLSPSIHPERLGDAGHLDLQEWVLRLARRRGWHAGLEVPTRPADPSRSVDVLVRAPNGVLVLECWNTIRDFGAAVRATTRKLVEAEALAHGRPVAAAGW